MNEDRFEYTHSRLPVGTACHTEFRGEIQMFIFGGWGRNTAGRYPIFYRVWMDDWWQDMSFATYSAVFTDTIMRKFPDLPERA